MRPGDVCLVYFTSARPRPTEKFAICVDPARGLFLLISTICYDPATDIPVTPLEIGCLTHPSHVNTGELFKFYEEDVRRVFEGHRIGRGVRNRIKRAVETHGQLPGGFERLVLERLCGVRPEQ